MKGWLNRAAGIIVGGILLSVTTRNSGPNTILGFYPPTSGEWIGADLVTLAVDAVAVWAIYRGLQPRHRPSKPN